MLTDRVPGYCRYCRYRQVSATSTLCRALLQSLSLVLFGIYLVALRLRFCVPNSFQDQTTKTCVKFVVCSLW